MPIVSHRIGVGGLTTLKEDMKPPPPARVQRAFTFAAATLVAVSGGSTATAGAARGHAHVDTTPTPMVTQRMLRGYFNAIRGDDKRTDSRMYRIPGFSDRTSLRLAAAAARALVP
jgi:hypothetical protein